MSQEQVNLFTDILLHGAMPLSDDPADFPVNPRLGTVVLKRNTIFCFVELGGVSTWFPISTDRNIYVHDQADTATVWEVSHNLGSMSPWVQARDANGTVVAVSSIEIVDANTIRATMDRSMAGRIVVAAPAGIDVPSVTADEIIVGNVRIDASGITVDGVPILTDGGIDEQIDNAVNAAMPPLGTAASLDVAVSGDASNDQAVKGDDTRLSNARPPLPHDHDDVYALIDHPHDYATVGHHHNNDYALIDHPHDYATEEHDHDIATATADGFMSASDKERLESIPYDVGGAALRTPEPGACITIHAVTHSLDFGTDFSRSSASALSDGTVGATYEIRVNNSAVGTLVFSAGSTAGVFNSNGQQVTCSPGDVISVHAPGTIANTAAGVVLTLSGKYS